MSITPGEVFSGIKFIQGVVSKVKDNRTNLQRLSGRLERIIVTIEQTKSRDAISSDDYNDAMTVLSELVERSHRATQKELKRSLGDRTWNRDEIEIEIKRIIEDVNHHLSTHSVSFDTSLSFDSSLKLVLFKIQVMDAMQSTNEKSFTMLTKMVSSGIEEIMAMVAALDQRLNTPPGPDWSPPILERAQNTWRQLAREVDEQSRQQLSEKLASGRGIGTSPNVQINNFRAPPSPQPVYHPDRNSRKTVVPSNDNLDLDIKSVRMMASQGRTSIQITGLRHSEVTGDIMERVTIENVHPYAHFKDILKAIGNDGYDVPDDLIEDQLLCTVTRGSTQFDATAPGGLQIDESMPLIEWWTKYTEYHGLAHATTPSHTLAKLSDDGMAVTAGGVQFRFHRTLRVPDGVSPTIPQKSLGMFTLVPVARYAHKLPPKVVKAGGFIIPMFQREAMRITFDTSSSQTPEAIKVSVGSLNAISGIPKDKPTTHSEEQDYIVAGLQPWLDGVMTQSGVVQQIVVRPHGGNYTVEGEVMREAKHSSMQFDVFPRRDERFGAFYHHTRGVSHWTPDGTLESDKTPDELELQAGSIIGVRDVPSMKGDQDLVKNWRLSSYRRRIHNMVHLNARYKRLPAPPTHDEDSSFFDIICCCFHKSGGSDDEQSSYEGDPPIEGRRPIVSQPSPGSTYPVAPIVVLPTYTLPPAQNYPVVQQSYMSSPRMVKIPSQVYSSPPSSTPHYPPFAGSPMFLPGSFPPDSPERYMLWSAASPPPPTMVPRLGLAPGRENEQRIYQDSVSPRMYDEEQGHRFHIHILSPSDWEIVTGVLPPISPITAESYAENNVPWFSIADDYLADSRNKRQPQQDIKSAHKPDRSQGFQLPDLVDPDRPPSCALHPRITSTCVFRPCSHSGCDSCSGTARKGSRCPKCKTRVQRLVGFKQAFAQIDGIAQHSTVSNNIAIIHLEGDRVAPLHAPPLHAPPIYESIRTPEWHPSHHMEQYGVREFTQDRSPLRSNPVHELRDEASRLRPERQAPSHAEHSVEFSANQDGERFRMPEMRHTDGVRPEMQAPPHVERPVEFSANQDGERFRMPEMYHMDRIRPEMQAPSHVEQSVGFSSNQDAERFRMPEMYHIDGVRPEMQAPSHAEHSVEFSADQDGERFRMPEMYRIDGVRSEMQAPPSMERSAEFSAFRDGETFRTPEAHHLDRVRPELHAPSHTEHSAPVSALQDGERFRSPGRRPVVYRQR
ncbi:hypothetical protein JAAARDRAFT_196109 [Jaapia argillacea MUCL 33604]|uniref:RING-type domain-containing protein n=1 Tax=Jaapia argillacea MUCL 33604 TaxID=933084 RepID=A0A067PY48_9AGAM|nr:hypothetical protein JAAARDRAFT_196109 [Jaapia argillacea MUCL 33604]